MISSTTIIVSICSFFLIGMENFLRFNLNSFDVESLPLRVEEIVQVVVAEEIVDILNAHSCHPQNIFGG